MRSLDWRLAGPMLLILVGGYFLFCQFFLITHARNGVFRPLSSLVLIPAARVINESVSYREVVEIAHGLEGFAPATPRREMFDTALAVSVYRAYVKSLAQELDIAVTRQEIVAYPIDWSMTEPGFRVAHWQERDYRKYVIKPLLLAQKTTIALGTNEVYQFEALETMASLRKKVIQGMPFAEVAASFSQNSSAAQRGDLGVMSVGTLPVWLRPSLVLTDSAPGTMSEVLWAPEALWTVTLIEFFSSEVREQATIHLRGLAVKKNTLSAVIREQMSAKPAWVFVW